MERRQEPWEPDRPRQQREKPWGQDQPRQRRRPRWSEFRDAYPRIVTAMAFGVALLLLFDAWLLYKRFRYQRQIGRWRAEMSEAERRRADAILAASENRTRFKLALIRRDSALDEGLNLAVSFKDGLLLLQREGARLREVPVRIGPESEVGRPPDVVRLAPPRGRFAVARVVDEDFAWEVPAWVFAQRGLAVPPSRRVPGALGPVAVLLTGGTVIYSDPALGPLRDPEYVLPGSVRASVADLRAMVENLQPGVPVYFY